MTQEEIDKIVSHYKVIGADYHGTFDTYKFPPKTAIITGSSDLGIEGAHCNDTGEWNPQSIGRFKAKKIKELGIDVFFDNDPEEVRWIKQYNKEANVIYTNRKNYVIFSYTMDGLPVGLRLLEEGNDAIVAVLSDKDVGEKLEDKEIDKRKNKIGEGLIRKYPAKQVFSALKDVKNKEDYFIIFDFNYGHQYAEKLEILGFNGFFPHKIDFDLEQDREKGQELVKKNFRKLKTLEEYQLKSVDDALKMIEERQKIFVVKCDNNALEVYVPSENNFDEYLKVVQNFFSENKSVLESNGFLLQEKLECPAEVIPETIYMLGKPVSHTADIEYKYIASGNVGNQIGCAADLVFRIKSDSYLAEVGLKDFKQIAKNRSFNGFMDAGIMIDRKTDTAYFSEFCSGRMGWNSFLTELAMMPSASFFFDSIILGQDPFSSGRQFGASVRVLNFNYDDDRYCKGDIELNITGNNVWLWDVYKKDGKIYTVGESNNVGCITATGSTAKEALENLKKNLDDIKFKNMYYRDDFCDNDGWYTLLNRYEYLVNNGWLDTIEPSDEANTSEKNKEKKYANKKGTQVKEN